AVGLGPVDTRSPELEHHPSVLVTQLGAMVFYGIAAVGFARRGGETGERVLASVALGATLGSFARLHYVLFAPTATGLVRTADVLRALFYAVLLVGAAREIETYWRGLAG